eukprot:CAMPEP_0115309744 /NCGR_PEP_ID=MMETSP0270-20121206/74417_1 /TAXON_ID=71861 /ORGANISM="Scrippsiella trochoidea, Strain CCMP3099" /LENGTH=68 /DNA_ID=CAMNT_0002728433 /DNA_START=53 /DNA_END=255 /DNA_ORIENTATION=+
MAPPLPRQVARRPKVAAGGAGAAAAGIVGLFGLASVTCAFCATGGGLSVQVPSSTIGPARAGLQQAAT